MTDRVEAEGTSSSLLTSSRLMAAGTIVSRLTGFVRAGLLAAAIGVSLHAEVFNVANTIPNSVYILVAGGVFNAVLVPQLVRAAKTDADGGDDYANRIITLGAVVLAGVTAVLVLAAPVLLQVFVDRSFFTDPALAAQRESLIDFTRWCLPQIFFYGMFVLIGQILNARGRFGPMMWTPIANNLIAIAVIVAYLVAYGDQAARGGYTTSQELLLGLGSTLGIVAQTLLLLPYLRAAGFSVRPRFDFRGTGLGHTLRLGMWTVGFVIVNQLAFYVMVHRATAGTAEVVRGDSDASGYTVYSNAFLLTQVPHSIITVSLATAAMPLLSRLAADHRLSEVSAEITSTLRLVLSVIVPCAVALLVLGTPMSTVLFSWGAASGETAALGETLMAFSIGMLMFSVHYLVLRGFYALEDTRTPFFIQCLVAAVNIACAIGLTMAVDPRFVAPALALAYGASYTVGAAVSFTVLSRRLRSTDSRSLAPFVLRVLVAGAAAGAVTWLCLQGLEAAGLNDSRKPDSLALLGLGGLTGMVSYLGMARLLGVSEIARILGLMQTRAKRG